MVKVTGRKSLRDRISEICQSVGMELTNLDILEDDYTTLFILRVSYWDLNELKAQGFWDWLEEVLPDDAECICSQTGANAFIIYRVEL